MKKLLLFFSCVLAVTCVNAGTSQDVKANKNLKITKARQISRAHSEGFELSSDLKNRNVSTRAEESNPIEGTWEFSFGDYYFLTSTNETITGEFVATYYPDKGLVFFEDESGEFLPFAGLLDEQTMELSFVLTILGTTTQYTVVQRPYIYNWDTEELDFQDIIDCEYLPEEGIINFELDNGLAWGAYGLNIDPTDVDWDEDLLGYFDIYDLEGAEQTAKADAGVESIGVDNITSTPQYFDINGLRMQQPEKGKITIIRKGNESIKILK